MATDERPLFVTRQVFLRRLARRLAASVVALGALHVLSLAERGEVPPATVPAIFSPASAPVAGGPGAEPNVATATAGTPRRAAATEPAPLPEARAAPLPRPAPGRDAERSAAVRKEAANRSATADVVVFDACRPDCDSRDPLLYGRSLPSLDETPAAADEAFSGRRYASREDDDREPAPDRRPGLVRGVYADARSLASQGLEMIESGTDLLNPW